MKGLSAADWEELARRAAYFPVLTPDGAVSTAENSDPTSAFFETGETDLAALLSAISLLLGRELSLTSTLDFGCGVGRLTVPLARRSGTVVACDVAPTMLAHARQNIQDAFLHNVTFTETVRLTDLSANQFDFVCSLLVLQYIPPSVGYEIIRGLLRVLAPGGVAALHVRLFEGRPVTRHRLTTIVSRRSRLEHATVESRPSSVAGIKTYGYDLAEIRHELDGAEAHLLGQLSTGQGEASGAVLIVQKS